MKFDVITGNPMIVKQENGKYQVVYAQPPLWAIQNYTDLTLEEVFLMLTSSDISLVHHEEEEAAEEAAEAEATETELTLLQEIRDLLKTEKSE